MNAISGAYGASNNGSAAAISLQNLWDQAGQVAPQLGAKVDSATRDLQAAYQSGNQKRIQQADLNMRKSLMAMEGYSQAMKVYFEAIMSQIRKLELR